MFTRRKQQGAVPEVGAEAPEFNLPSAQGGQLRLSMRTVRGPVAVIFLRGPWSEEDVEYFKALAAREDEINHAGASVVGIGVLEPEAVRDFVEKTGIKSYVLYDYTGVATRQWGLLERDRDHGEYARPAVFIVNSDHKVSHSWVGERPKAEDVLAKVTELTGLPKPPEESEPEKAGGEGGGEAPKKKMSAEERDKIKAERRAAREAGKSVKTPQGEGDGKPAKMSAEERERIKAQRRAAREAGESPKSGAPQEEAAAPSGEAPKKKMSAEERERIKAERRAAREAGKSVKKPSGAAGPAPSRTESDEKE